jgi:tRNA threonylcarbamoyladenosine biosynthesis protein TsaE
MSHNVCREYMLSDLTDVARQLRSLLSTTTVMTFTGTLGAGKTTLIKSLLYECGVKDLITSPTFTYVNKYKNQQGQQFYHFDLYRLHSIDEFISAGFDEYLYAPHSWCFIEWPEIIMPLLNKNVCHCVITYGVSWHNRTICYSCKS